jgi:hypothetical protein
MLPRCYCCYSSMISTSSSRSLETSGKDNHELRALECSARLKYRSSAQLVGGIKAPTCPRTFLLHSTLLLSKNSKTQLRNYHGCPFLLSKSQKPTRIWTYPQPPSNLLQTPQHHQRCAVAVQNSLRLAIRRRTQYLEYRSKDSTLLCARKVPT